MRILMVSWEYPPVVIGGLGRHVHHLAVELADRAWTDESEGMRTASFLAREAGVPQRRAKQLIRVGHSPDPDDAFMFHALANDCIDTGKYRFTHELVDIETLNRRAFQGELELTAVSIHATEAMPIVIPMCASVRTSNWPSAAGLDTLGPMTTG